MHHQTFLGSLTAGAFLLYRETVLSAMWFRRLLAQKQLKQRQSSQSPGAGLRLPPSSKASAAGGTNRGRAWSLQLSNLCPVRRALLVCDILHADAQLWI